MDERQQKDKTQRSKTREKREKKVNVISTMKVRKYNSEIKSLKQNRLKTQTSGGI